MSYTIDPMYGYRIPIPLTYAVDTIILDVGNPGLNKPSDLFIDDKGLLYVADTDNNRIVKLSARARCSAFTARNRTSSWISPAAFSSINRGICSSRIREAGRSSISPPKGKLSRNSSSRNRACSARIWNSLPTKSFMDRRGYLYVLNKNDYSGFMMIDAMNRFRGYIGANRVPFDWKKLLIRLLATPEQREQLNNAVPHQNANLTMDGKGLSIRLPC